MIFISRTAALGLAALVILTNLSAQATAQQAAPETQDLFKRAGSFIENCDARANKAGQRPEPNYWCLSFVAGVIEGYNYAAVANGNPRPYCLPRPTSLVELMDMMATVIERGVPPETPTAAVFHLIMEVNFQCPDAEAAPQEDPKAADGAGETAQ